MLMEHVGPNKTQVIYLINVIFHDFPSSSGMSVTIHAYFSFPKMLHNPGSIVKGVASSFFKCMDMVPGTD